MNPESLMLVDAAGNQVAELQITDELDGWFSGTIASQQFPQNLREALDWYGEVVENQMLSFLDQATASVEHFGLGIRYPNGATRRIFSLHATKQGEVSFRTSPVPPPAWLTKSESA